MGVEVVCVGDGGEEVYLVGVGDEEGGDEEEEEGGELEEEVGYCCVVVDEFGWMVWGGGWVCRCFGVCVCGLFGEFRLRIW